MFLRDYKEQIVLVFGTKRLNTVISIKTGLVATPSYRNDAALWDFITL